ncbi:TetR/AcrR family transcriptional regulator [Paenibacillus woosongensis]|nr:TetR/AcrR family transcriptional regulator [Paenibacillus woosongensis]
MESFVAILQNREYAEISIIDISERANINRSTLYAHFLDKEDLLQQMVDEKLDTLTGILKTSSGQDMYIPSSSEPDPLLLALFEHVFTHAAFYRVLLHRDLPGQLRAKWTDAIRDGVFCRISSLGLGHKLEAPLELLLDFIAFATDGIISKWLEDNCAYSPHHMALQVTRIAGFGMYPSMGIHR